MMFLPRPFLLMVGDDGALLIPPKSPPILALSHEMDESAPLLHALAEDPTRPVLILADTLAQEVRQEKIPPLNLWDRRKLLARRLAQAFHAPEGHDAPLKGSVTLSRDKALFACLHAGGAVALWQERLAALSNPFQGVALLPVESAALLCRLHPATREGWGLLLSLERTGGFRQIITLDGEPILTRLTALPHTNTSLPYAIGTIAVDLQATRDYLARFGLAAGTPLRLVTLLPENLHAAVGALALESTEITVLTPHEAAQSLLLPIGPAPDDPASDLLHAAWLQSRLFPRLVLLNPQHREARLHQTIRRLGFACAGLLACFLLGALLIGGKDIGTLWARGAHLKTALVALQAEMKAEEAKMPALAEPLGQLRQAVAFERVFEAKRPSPFEALSTLQSALPEDLFLSSFIWDAEGGLVFTLRLPETTKASAIEEELASALPEGTLTLLSSDEEGMARFRLQQGEP